MTIAIKEINNKNEWENFLLSSNTPIFLQSWNMGILHVGLGDKIWRLGIYKNNNLVGLAFIAKITAKRGTFLYCPYGPIFNNWQMEYFTTLVNYLKMLGEREKCHFLKISPFIENTEQNLDLFKKSGFRNAPIHILAETLWLLDLNKSEEELLSGMRKTTRNLIRRAEKENVQIKISRDINNLEIFINLHQKTVQRHHFTPYTEKYFREQVKAFLADDQVCIFNAFLEDKPIASAIIMFYGRIASYHHGASEISKVPASYLLQWAAIKEAKKRNCSLYNFWGIYEGNKKSHPFAGITLFKTGFGGYKKELLHCQDLPLSNFYSIYYLIELYRKIKRGF